MDVRGIRRRACRRRACRLCRGRHRGGRRRGEGRDDLHSVSTAYVQLDWPLGGALPSGPCRRSGDGRRDAPVPRDRCRCRAFDRSAHPLHGLVRRIGQLHGRACHALTGGRGRWGHARERCTMGRACRRSTSHAHSAGGHARKRRAPALRVARPAGRARPRVAGARCHSRGAAGVGATARVRGLGRESHRRGWTRPRFHTLHRAHGRGVVRSGPHPRRRFGVAHAEGRSGGLCVGRAASAPLPRP